MKKIFFLAPFLMFLTACGTMHIKYDGPDFETRVKLLEFESRQTKLEIENEKMKQMIEGQQMWDAAMIKVLEGYKEEIERLGQFYKAF